jgi:CXXX repeat radical SAM target protein
MNRREFLTKTAKCVLPSIALLGLSTMLNGYSARIVSAGASDSCGGSCSGTCTKTCASDCSGGSYWSA